MHNKQRQMSLLNRFLFLMITTCILQSPAQSAEPETPFEQPDPYQKFNRAMFSLNDRLDIYFLKPVATFYNKIMPKPLNEGVNNFFRNIRELPTIANDLLQANFYQATKDFWRLAINTTVGVGGLFDIATRMNLPYYENDFGLTLSTWGYRQSNYLVLPFWGPNTLRDGISLSVDYFAFSIYPHINPTTTRYELYALGVLDRRAQLLQYQSVFDEAAIDKYAFVRNAYLQRRAFQIEQNAHLSYQDQKTLEAPVTTSSTTDSTASAVTAEGGQHDAG